jgi:hypothetical protein
VRTLVYVFRENVLTFITLSTSILRTVYFYPEDGGSKMTVILTSFKIFPFRFYGKVKMHSSPCERPWTIVRRRGSYIL